MRAQVHIQLLYIPNRVSIYQKTLKDEYSQLLKCQPFSSMYVAFSYNSIQTSAQ